MADTTPPPANGRMARLVRSVVIMSVAAAVLIVTVVLPAEYGIDPTGIGERLGLRQMGEIKERLAREAAAQTSPESPAIPNRSDNK